MPDENYAREILQLFSIGLYELNADGTPRLDGDGKPIETYNNSDITGLARVFTGLDLDVDGGFDEEAEDNLGYADSQCLMRPMRVFADDHSSLEKQFLGSTIPANTDAQSSISTALDIIFNHPNVGPFIARQLIQRLVTSHPRPAYVARVAMAFDQGSFQLPDGDSVGTGQRGDLAATVAAILFDLEARDSVVTASTFGKVRPVLRLTAWARALVLKCGPSTSRCWPSCKPRKVSCSATGAFGV